MRLSNFEKQVPAKILQRGERYFESESVVELDEIDDEMWEAIVLGTGDSYEVFISLDEDEVADWTCTCPYDWGNICKHVVAVLFEIREVLDADLDEIDYDPVTEPVKEPASSADPKDLPPLFQSLSPAEQKLLLIAALIGGSVFQTRLSGIYAKANAQTRARRTKLIDIRPFVQVLTKNKLLKKRGQHLECPETIAHDFCEYMAQNGSDLKKLTPLIRQEYPVYSWYNFSNEGGGFREMRLARYEGKTEAFKRQYLSLVNHFSHGYSQDSLLNYWLSPSFDQSKLEALPIGIRTFLLSEKITLQTFYLTPFDEFFHYAVDNIAELDKTQRPHIARLLAQLFIFQGNWQGLEKMLPFCRESDGLVLAGIHEFVKGKNEQALAAFELATKKIRKETRKNKTVLLGLGGIFQVLAMFKTRDLGLLKNIKKHLTRLLNERSSFSPAYEYLHAVHFFLLNDSFQARYLLEEKAAENDLMRFFRILCQFWVDDSLILQQEFENFYSKVASNGYEWLATEILAIKNELVISVQSEKAAKKLVDELGIVPLFKILPRMEAWENALNALLSIGGISQKNKQTKEARLVWIVDFENEQIQAKEQSFGKNGWTKGRAVAFHRLRSGALDCLSEQDQHVISALGFGEGSVLNVYEGRVWKALVGHPLLFHWKSPSTAIQLLQAELQVMVRKLEEGYQVSLSHDLPEEGIHIVKETPTRYLLVEVTERMAQVAKALNNQSIIIPEEGMARLKEAVSGISNIVPVQSVFEDENLPSVEADARLHIHLLPVGDGFHVEPYMKPFRETPPYVKPGEGEPILVTTLDGNRIRTTRDLKAEKDVLKKLLGSVPILKETRRSQGIWELEDTERCLELLLQLEPLIQSEEIILDWPKGEKFHISKVAEFDQLRIEVRGENQWFTLSGELPIDEDRVLSMQELLLLSEQQGQFIELSPGKFLALTNHFRNLLQEAGTFLSAQKKGGDLQLHPLAAPAMEAFWEGLKHFKVDEKFQESRKRLKAAFAKKFKPPKKFKAALRPYQREGFEWLHRCAAWGVGACLADDMGLGKTIEALAFLTDRAKMGPALVIAPASVCRNWRAETEKFAPALKPILFGEGDRKAMVESVSKGDLLIATYDLMAREEELFIEKKFATVVLDEAQAIKNWSTRRSKTAMQLQGDFKMILTGTPLENHLGELWNLFQFINPGLLGSLERFNERFALPIEKYKDEDRRNQLRRLVQPFILRRRKDEVLQDLPEKTEITLSVELSQEEMVFYEALRRNALEKLTADTDSQGGQKHLQILAEIMRLRRAACHPKLVDENAGFSSSAKLRLFEEIVEELLDNDHKALVFSQFVGHLRILEKLLKKKKISYQYLDGQTPLPKRQKRIEAFQAGEGDLFLISLKAGGVGLNLTAADYVIHTDPWWNPAVEDQATDRAHRIGQERPVTVYRLVAENTIEEKILALHEKKRDLADSLLSGTNVSAKLSADDLLALLADT